MIKFEKLIQIYPIIILIAVSIIAIIPFFNSGFFPIHDDTQVQRVFEMKKALTDGMLPVRWIPDLGYSYGYPIFNYYGPLPYYIGAIISFLGSPLLATKIMIAGAIVGSSFSMYLLTKEFWGRIGGLLSSVLYLFAPYHALNVYVRGDVGEVYAFLFIPLIFYGIWKYFNEEKFKYIIIGSLSYAGLITSHNLSAMMITPFIFLVVVILIYKRRNFSLLLIPLIGILVSSFYSLPAFLEKDYTDVMRIIGMNAEYREHFVCPAQLWDSLWMYGGSVPGCVDGLSFRIGKPHIALTFISLILALLFFKKGKQQSLIVIFAFLLSLISIFLLLDASSNIWNLVPYMNYFQFPWRFLLLVSFFSSFLVGSIIFFISKINLGKNQKILVSIISFMLIISPVIIYQKLFVPKEYVYKTSENYTNKDYLNFETSKISDEYMPKSFKTPKVREEIFREKIRGQNINVTNVSEKTNRLSADINVREDTTVLVHIPYFPAWKYYINQNPTKVNEIDVGVSFPLQKGSYEFLAKFEQTLVERIANVISLSGVGIIIAGIIYGRKSRWPRGK